MRSRGERSGAARSGQGLARTALIALCAVCVTFAFAATASATAPTPNGSFNCSTTPDLDCSNEQAAVDQATGDVYLIDGGHDAVDRFDASGNYISQIRGASTTAGGFGFGSPTTDAIAVDNSGGANQGNVYVVSETPGLSGGDAIFAFDPYGRELWERGTVAGDTCGIGVDSRGNPWAADWNGQEVAELRVADGGGTGTVISTASHGDNPCQIAFDSNDNVYVANYGANLDEFDSSGAFVKTVTPGSAWAVATDLTTNEVYAVINHVEVDFWDSAGNLDPGSPFGQQVNLSGVAVDGAHGNIYVVQYSGTSEVDKFVRASGAPEPYVRTQDASGVAATGATLNGMVNPAGESTTCTFEYVDDTQFQSNVTSNVDGFTGAQSQACDSAPGSGTSDVAVSTTLSGLMANTVYHARLVASNSAGTNNGSAVTFDTSPPTHTLTATVSGNGRVDDDQGRIVSCTSSGGSNCSGTYDEGTVVTLAATPGAHQRFTGWSGDCSGTAACQVTMGSDRNVTATFAQIQHNVTVNCTGSGSVAPVGCGQTQAKNEGSSVALTATPASGWRFDGWSGGGCSGTGTCNMTVSADTTVSAAFSQIPPSQHTLTVSTSGSGTVTSSSGGINCGSACNAAFNDGTSVTLTATPASGWQFASWSGGGCSGTGTCTVTISAATSVTATFTQITQPPPPGTLVVNTRSASVSKGKASLKVTCQGDSGSSCNTTLKLAAKVKKGKKKKTIVVGSVTVHLTAGQSATVTLKLSGAAKSALAKRPHKLSATASGTNVQRKTVTLKLAVAKKRKKKHSPCLGVGARAPTPFAQFRGRASWIGERGR